MEIQYGANVIDRDGKVIGTVDHLVRNTWTGEITKFIVRRKAPETDLLFSTEDVLEMNNTSVRLNTSFHELSGNEELVD